MSIKKYDRKLILENGMEIPGFGFGYHGDKVCELVFNTSMVGYQEIFSDPSYTDQAVVMTYPLIGNYGVADWDYETEVPTISAFIVREICDYPSNFRCTNLLQETMEKFKVCGIEGIDTRKLTRIIRDHGSCQVLITDIDTPVEEGLQKIKEAGIPHDAVSRVSPQKMICDGRQGKYHVVIIDCGMKKNIMLSLQERGCRVTRVPFDADAETILSMRPDGVMISNGPGDPQDVPEVINTVRNLHGKVPIFGICLGNQIIALSYGANTYKLKFGHRGGNHPVKNLLTEKVEITSQNHSYAVDPKTIENTGLTITHINLLDNTVEGIACKEDNIFGVQYHPESNPGPQDSRYLFDQFIENMKGGREHA